MSTTLQVYPRSSKAPSFQEVLELASIRTHQQLLARGVAVRPNLTVSLRSNETHEVLPLDLSSPAKWGTSEYAWFAVDGVPGGTDVSCWLVESDELEYWELLTSEHPPAIAVRNEVLACLSSGVCWSFRRSAGQPAVIAFVYGILAAAMAELTDGFVFSDDSAWEYARFPAKAHEVYDWYFNPEKALDPKFAKWANECLAAISNAAGA